MFRVSSTNLSTLTVPDASIKPISLSLPPYPALTIACNVFSGILKPLRVDLALLPKEPIRSVS